MKKVLASVVCAAAVVSMSANCFATELMKRGSRGDEVKEVQEMLISSGYLTEDGADGKFGPKTEQAVLAFQQDNGLDATGIVGDGTVNALKADKGSDVQPAEDADEAEGTEQQQGEEPAEEIDYAETFPSWNPDSATLDELVTFVNACTDEASPDYLEPADRLATFDMDGTILCEKAPIYVDYCLTMYRVLDDPTYDATEVERDAMQQIRDYAYTYGEKFYPKTVTKSMMVASAFAGMTPEEFREYVCDFADTTDVVGFEGMTYGESFYRPMLEVIAYLKDNDFDVWIVSACEREVTRALVERYDIPLDHVIATDVPYVASGKGDDETGDEYNMGQDETILLGKPLGEECGKSNKAAAIMREIGKHPVLAFGNSSGDYSMLNFAESNPDHTGNGFFVVCDDTVREYGSDEKAAEYYAEVEKEGWTPISMANDWKNIYGEGVKKTALPGAEKEADQAA
ncbi:MAG TPA: haloacid dehalogenase-like hydrolase [Lachnospiraceae bacterium]|nr:haloacid dehalogenase-like hydrolase [Lachnospiraceae bacterium]